MDMLLQKIKFSFSGREVKLFLPPVFVLTFSLFVFVFMGCTDDPPRSPRLTTHDIAEQDITSSTAILKGELTSLGTMKIEEYGIILSKNMLFDPYVTEKSSQPAVLGVYQFEFTGLQSNTLYYYKAYALVNTAMVFSENLKQFTTKTTP
jgi:hypothetical protein